jgi:tetratricopeptide (TPR) repeat protein
MNLRLIVATLGAVLMAAGAGCGPQPAKRMTLAEALSARVDRQADYNEAARFIETSYLSQHDKDYVMWSMDYSSLCLMGGNYDAAKDELMRCHADIQKTQDTGKEKLATISNEAFKIFKGEPFERAMLCTYLGILHYMDGDYNNARIFLNRADMEDATTANNMAGYRHDFQLAHYWLGRAFLKLGQEDNARIAFDKAGQHIARKGEERELKYLQRQQAQERKSRIGLEQECYKRATTSKEPVAGAVDVSASPAWAEMPAAQKDASDGEVVEAAASSQEQFLSPAFQKSVNLILVIEAGAGPIKFVSDYGDQIVPFPYQERRVMVYLDGHKAGEAYNLLDMYHQAATRGTSEKDTAQAAKAITKAILKQISSAADYWDIKADWRYWQLLPWQVHVFAAKVKPGRYTLNIQCFDSNGYLLPRYSITRSFLPVLPDQENIYMLHTLPEADNVYVATKK